MSIDKLKAMYPWPDQKPDVPPNPQGWFGAGNRRILARELTPETKLVIELGSWLGESTRFILDHAPNATVFAVDHWEGSAEHLIDPKLAAMLPSLYETFLVNCWQYKDRLIPVRTLSLIGTSVIARYLDRDTSVDLIYIDASHDEDDVYNDIYSSSYWFPTAKLVGDDWKWDSVRAAVENFAKFAGRSIEVDDNAWMYRH